MGAANDGDDAGNERRTPSVHQPMELLTVLPGPPPADATSWSVPPDQDAAPLRRWHPSLVQVYENRYDDFVRLAYLLTGQTAVAEEIVQDAFIASHRSWDRIRDPAPYVRAAVVNRCYSWGRRLRLERERQPPPPDPAELVADEMWDALAELNDRQRTAIVLRFYADLPDKEIAQILRCRVATVRTTIHRGLRVLRKAIEQ